MKYGFTTGSCAAAAAKAAAYMLLTGKIKNCITIETPKGIPYTAEVTDIVRGESQVSCAVVKDGGDVCRNCHRKKDGAEKRRKRSTVRRNSVLFTGVFKAHIELHVRKKNQQIPA